MNPELIILDMDGTLADTSPGILESYRYVADWLGKDRPDDEEMFSRMGGSLHENISRIYGLDAEETQRAVDAYRDYYGREGYLQSILYPGMLGLLEEARFKGIPVSIATMKLEEIAVSQVRHWGIEGLFQSVNGSDMFGAMSKSDIIDRAIYRSGVSPGDAIMVGDSPNDLHGARRSGVPFLAVTYGYGFTKGICEDNGIDYAESPQGIMRKIFP